MPSHSHARYVSTLDATDLPITPPHAVHADRGALALVRQLLREDLNFLITNRIPRRFLTELAGRVSRVESPSFTRLAIAVWSRLSGDLHLEEADTSDFTSIRSCFTRKLRAGVRPIASAADVAVSPCDAIVGASGTIDHDTLVQAKGLTYRLGALLGDDALAARHHGGAFVTLRLTASMYHRFHAPCDATFEEVRYISGDTWNVNPIAVRRIENLFCRNERVVLDLRLNAPGASLTLVPVAAILVASIRLHALPEPFTLRYRGPNVVRCAGTVQKGEELGWFENGSTIIVLASGGFAPSTNVREGAVLRMGQPLFHLPGCPLSGSLPTSDVRQPHDHS